MKKKLPLWVFAAEGGDSPGAGATGQQQAAGGVGQQGLPQVSGPPRVTTDSGGDSDPTEGADGAPSQFVDGDGERFGFPANTALAQMTEPQRTEYWRHKAKKHEARASARQDYDALKSELTELKSRHQTESEKALEAARAEGRTTAARELGEKAVDIHVNALVSVGRLSRAAADAALAVLDKAKLIGEDGMVDDEKLTQFLDHYAGPVTGGDETPDGEPAGPPQSPRWRRDPHQGNRGSKARPVRSGAELRQLYNL